MSKRVIEYVVIAAAAMATFLLVASVVFWVAAE
jgi:hypothetical protein